MKGTSTIREKIINMRIVFHKTIPLLLLGWGIFVLSCVQKISYQFDGDRAYSYLLAQTDFGPRNPGSEGHEKCLDFLIAEL